MLSLSSSFQFMKGNSQMVIRVGNTRINLDNVAYVKTHMSDILQKSTYDGHIFENQEASVGQKGLFNGLVAKVTFNATSDEGNLSHTFFAEDADDFIELYDAFANTIDIETLRRQKGN